MPRPKSPPDSRVTEFRQYAARTFEERTGRKLAINFTVAGRLIKSALAITDDLDTLKRYWDFFLIYNGTNDFLKNKVLKSIETFCSAKIFNLVRQKYAETNTSHKSTGAAGSGGVQPFQRTKQARKF